MLIDSHCHLASHKFGESEIPQLIARAKENGVSQMIALATSDLDIEENVALAQNHAEIRACIGIHPCDVHTCPDDFEAILEPHLQKEEVVALGETGLDYFHPAPENYTEEVYHKRQRDFLRRHFELAAKANLNVVIHTRDRKGRASLLDALEIYREYSSEVKAVFHCFSSSWELANEILELGGYLSFTGIATFKNAKTVLEVASQCPLDRFFVETDAPYLAPEPRRGKRNEPAFLLYTAEAIAKVRGVSLAELSTQTTKNCQDFFRI